MFFTWLRHVFDLSLAFLFDHSIAGTSLFAIMFGLFALDIVIHFIAPKEEVS